MKRISVDGGRVVQLSGCQQVTWWMALTGLTQALGLGGRGGSIYFVPRCRSVACFTKSFLSCFSSATSKRKGEED